MHVYLCTYVYIFMQTHTIGDIIKAISSLCYDFLIYSPVGREHRHMIFPGLIQSCHCETRDLGSSCSLSEWHKHENTMLSLCLSPSVTDQKEVIAIKSSYGGVSSSRMFMSLGGFFYTLSSFTFQTLKKGIHFPLRPHFSLTWPDVLHNLTP